MRASQDFDGDGRRDLVKSVPDALASTANYLQRAGWKRGERWGFEVRVPKALDASLAGRKNARTLSDWRARGVTRIDGSPLPQSEARAALLLPAGKAGPAWLALRNWRVYSYNAAKAMRWPSRCFRLPARRPAAGRGLPTDDPASAARARAPAASAHRAQPRYRRGRRQIGTRTRRAIVAERNASG